MIDIGEANLNSLTEEEINILKEYLQENYIDVYSVMPNRESLPQGDKEFIISLFEICYPEYAENINTCLEPIVEEGRTDVATNIKVIAYTAPDPYRTVFLASANEIKFVDLHWEGTANYNSFKGGISINIDSVKYVTIFHECGHAIDDISYGSGAITDFYRNADGKTLSMVLEENVRTTIHNCAEQYFDGEGGKDDIIQEVENIIMNCSSSDNFCLEDFPDEIKDTNGNNIAESVKACYVHVIGTLQPQMSNISSDIYGGFTGNLLRNGSGHDEVNENGRVYWIEGSYSNNSGHIAPLYELDGTLGYKSQESEFFAEYFAAYMVNNQDDLDSLVFLMEIKMFLYKEQMLLLLKCFMDC